MLSIRIIEMHPGADDILFVSVVNTEGKIMYHQEVLLLDEYGMCHVKTGHQGYISYH